MGGCVEVAVWVLAHVVGWGLDGSGVCWCWLVVLDLWLFVDFWLMLGLGEVKEEEEYLTV